MSVKDRDRPTDFKPERLLVTPDVFAGGPDGPYPAPAHLVEEDVWDALTGLSDHVAIMASDHHGALLGRWWQHGSAWRESCHANGSSDLLSLPMVDASFEFDARTTTHSEATTGPQSAACAVP